MIKFKLAPILLTGAVIIVGCNNNSQSKDIKLDDSKIWVVNAEMKPHIDAEIALLNQFVAQKDQDYLELSKNLKIKNDSLIKSCTMTGESHDELHNWLLPHIELINQLSLAENFNEAESVISQLEKSFQTYKSRFR